jgi:hypothetical protein
VETTDSEIWLASGIIHSAKGFPGSLPASREFLDANVPMASDLLSQEKSLKDLWVTKNLELDSLVQTEVWTFTLDMLSRKVSKSENCSDGAEASFS